MNTYNQYLSLLKILLKDKYKTASLFGFKTGRQEKKQKSKVKKIFSVLGVCLLVLLIGSYLVSFVVMGTAAAINGGIHKGFLGLLIGLTQFIVFFFGITATMGYLYYSKDNSLLSSLPLNSKAVFLAKFTMAYITQFIVAAFFLLFSLTTFGIVSAVHGISIGVEFYLLTVLSILLVPFVPLLIITFISLPVMKLINVLKKSSFSQSIIISIVFIGIMSLYFVVINSFNNISDENAVLSPQIIGLVNIVEKGFIFNAPLINAMLGKSVFLNTLFYLFINFAGLGIAVYLSSLFYSKSINTLIEGTGVYKSKGQISDSKIVSNKASFLKKELKTLINTPMLFMQSIMGVVMAPLITLIMGYTYLSLGDELGDESGLFAVGFILYLASLMINATNVISMIGFSREGKHLFVLKSLPISAKEMVDSKLNISLVITFFSSFLVAVVYAFVARSGFFIPLGIFIVLITISVALSSFSLLNDLKDPNLDWKNINELTKNNKRTLKPALLMLAIGFFYIIYSVVLTFISNMSSTYTYLVFFITCIVINVILAYIFYKKLYNNPQELFDIIE